jgi:hypothetical protein
MADALAPFRKPQPPRPNGDPAPLPHLFDTQDTPSILHEAFLDDSEAQWNKGDGVDDNLGQ